MQYVQITDAQRTQMLDAIGVDALDDLLVAVPEEIRLGRPLELPDAMSEQQLSGELQRLADLNSKAICFAGAGAYDHYIPAVVDSLSARGEFVTAYTPYQAEASQGLLQVFFEFQSLICRLSGMDVANASMYEAATAMAEAVIMVASTSRDHVMICEPVHPHYLATARSYMNDLSVELDIIPARNGQVDFEAAVGAMTDRTAAIVVQSPNFFGNIEAGLDKFTDTVHDAGACVVQVFDPISLGLLKRPGDIGVDVAVAEGQPLGMPLSFGGPYLGLFATSKKFLRKIPGRLIGRTADAEGLTSYCLTLQTREQHIRRAKATSNICSNQGLCAVRASIYLAAMGPNGLKNAASLSMKRAYELYGRITCLDGYKAAFPAAKFFREFVVRCVNTDPEKIIEAGLERGILPGVAMGRFDSSMADCLMLSCTEKRTGADIESLVQLLGDMG